MFLPLEQVKGQPVRRCRPRASAAEIWCAWVGLCRIVIQEELQKFYHAFVDVLFKHSLPRTFVVVKVSRRRMAPRGNSRSAFTRT